MKPTVRGRAQLFKVNGIAKAACLVFVLMIDEVVIADTELYDRLSALQSRMEDGKRAQHGVAA